MKAWRQKANQERVRAELVGAAIGDLLMSHEGSAEHRHYEQRILDLRRARMGKVTRDNFVRVLPVPSPIMQALLIRGGYAYN